MLPLAENVSTPPIHKIVDRYLVYVHVPSAPWDFVVEDDDDSRTPDFDKYDVQQPHLGTDGFSATIKQIFALVAGDESDGYGVLRPTDYAQRKTLKLLSRAQKAFADDVENRQLGLSFPKGFVATDSEGGIRIEWLNGDKTIRLVVPASENGQSYIYFEDDSEYGTSDRVNGSVLAHFLRLVR